MIGAGKSTLAKALGEAVEGLVTDPFKLIMVREKRADAHMNDNNYDEEE